MMSRQAFLSGMGLVPFSSIASSRAEANTHPQIIRRTVINSIAGYANLGKGFQILSDPENSDANGWLSDQNAFEFLDCKPSMPSN
jgi:hypothetical protein